MSICDAYAVFVLVAAEKSAQGISASSARITLAAQITSPSSPLWPTEGDTAAAWALANGLRNELREQGTLVVAVHAGYIDTDMVKGVDAPKSRPEDIANALLKGIEAGEREVLADDTARHVRVGFNLTPPIYLGGPE